MKGHTVTQNFVVALLILAEAFASLLLLTKLQVFEKLQLSCD